jgi:phosphinothricin acetyltransferase
MAMIRPVEPRDFDGIAEIYNYYIQNSIATFEEEAISGEEMGRRVADVTDGGWPWLVAAESDRVVGYCYAKPWNIRAAYRHTVESSVYLDPAATGAGWGSRLYQALFEILGQKTLHVIIGGVALPNQASVALHEKFGFEKVAHFQQVGFKFGQWIDVGYWQVNPQEITS